MGFHTRVARVLEQINIETCHVSMATQHLFWSIKNCASQNVSLKTRTSKLTTHRNMSSFDEWPNTHFDSQAARPPKHIPPKHVTFWELCFNPIRPSPMFPHAIPIHAP